MDEIKIEINLDLRDFAADAESDLYDRLLDTAAQQLLSKISAGNERELQKQFAALVEGKLDAALGAMAERTVDEVLESPYSWNLRAAKSMTLREAMADKLDTWLTERVDSQGRPTNEAYGSRLRVNGMVDRAVDAAWKKELHEEVSKAREQVRDKMKDRITEIVANALMTEKKK